MPGIVSPPLPKTKRKAGASRIDSPNEALTAEEMNIFHKRRQKNIAETADSSDKVAPRRRQRRSVTKVTYADDADDDEDEEDIEGANLAEVDEVNERRAGVSKRVVEMQQEDFTNPVASPSSSGERRKDYIAPPTMTNSQLAEHYQCCIRLCAENKINAKNAFDLHLIDYLNEILNNQPSGELNFQMAGATIDAGAKIYAYRVDCVHQEVFRMMGGLGRLSKDKRRGKNDRHVVDGDDFNQDDDNNEQGATPRRKRKKLWKGKTIEKNLKNITAPIQIVEFEQDSLFLTACTAYDNGTTAGLFLNNLKTTDDGSLMQLHCYLPQQELGEYPKECVPEFMLSDVRCNLAKVLHHNFSSACPPIESFTFCPKDEDGSDVDDDPFGIFKDSADDQFKFSSVIPNATAFSTAIGNDASAIASDSGTPAAAANEPLPFLDDHQLADDDDGGAASDADSIAAPLRAVPVKVEASENANVTGGVLQFLSTKPLEYSYFNQHILQTWQGPSHWKLLPQPKAREHIANNDGQPPAKKKRKKIVLDFPGVGAQSTDDDADDDGAEFSLRQFGPSTSIDYAVIKLVIQLRNQSPSRIPPTPPRSRRVTTLARATQEKWLQADYMVDPSIDYKVENLYRMFLRPADSIVELKDSQTTPQGVVEGAGADDPIGGVYNYENANDVEQFCPDEPMDGPQEVGGDNDDSDDNGGGAEELNDSRGTPPPVAMLEPPKEMEMLPEPSFKPPDLKTMKYARVAKRIDVRRLKQLMWAILTGNKKSPAAEEDAGVGSQSFSKGSADSSFTASSPSSSQKEPKESVAGKHSFKKLFQAVMAQSPPATAKDLTPHIVFVCFLHMCNEKTLALADLPDMSDLIISQD